MVNDYVVRRSTANRSNVADLNHALSHQVRRNPESSDPSRFNFHQKLLPCRDRIVRYSDESKVFRPFGGSLGGAKEAQSHRVRYWEIIADNLSKAGWSWGCVSAIDSEGRTI
jgi:hypothetical protein